MGYLCNHWKNQKVHITAKTVKVLQTKQLYPICMIAMATHPALITSLTSINNEACVLIQALCHKASDCVKRKPPSFLGIYEQFQFHFDASL